MSAVFVLVTAWRSSALIQKRTVNQCYSEFTYGFYTLIYQRHALSLKCLTFCLLYVQAVLREDKIM